MTTCWRSSTASDDYADGRGARQREKPTDGTRRQRPEQRVGIVVASAQFVYALLRADHDNSPDTQTGERIARIAAGGVRLVVGEMRTDVTKTRKDGSRGRLRIDYGDHRDPQAALAWLWKLLDGAKTAGELYGRALVVIAAEQHATRLVVPSSQRMPATRWSSHKYVAAKALKKLAGPHIPASLTKLEQAVKRAHAAYDKAETGAREQQRAERQPVEAEPDYHAVDGELDEDLDEAAPVAARWRADPPPEDGTPWRACGWRGIGSPAGRAPTPEGSPRWPAASTVSRSPTRSATPAARPTASASSKPRAPCSPRRAGSAGSWSGRATASRDTRSVSRGPASSQGVIRLRPSTTCHQRWRASEVE